jgi:AcrR family transcriptional regulator
VPRPFTPAERDRIRTELLAAGRRYFTSQGLLKTTLADLTAPAGIHKTAFYAFFPSKEALYLELLALERPGIEARLAPHFAARGVPADDLAGLLRAIVRELEENPLVRRLLTHPQELAAVSARVAPADLAAKTDALLPLRAYVAEAQATGRLLGADPDVVVGALRAVTLVTLHRADLGEALYPSAMEVLIEGLARGLTPTAAAPRGGP